jgi:hypothetical protein
MSGKVADEFSDLVAAAAQAGDHIQVLRAYRAIVEALERDPIGFGEAREILPAMGVRTRIGFEPPLVVRFGVQDEARIVWLQSIRIRRRSR